MLVFKRDDDVVSAELEFNDPFNECISKGKLIFGKYSTNDALAVDLYMFMEENDAYDGWQPYATLSVNLPVPPAENCFYLKNYSENAELVKQFEGVLYAPLDEDTKYIASGYVDIPEVRLTDEVIASLEALNNKPVSTK